MEWLYGIGISTIIALQGWILVEIIALKVKTAQYDSQIGRLVSNAESEKKVQRDTHHDHEQRLRALEHPVRG